MKATIAAMLLFGCSGTGPKGEVKPKPKPGGDVAVATDGKAPDGEIVTAEVTKMNSAAYGRPPAQFRAGQVSRIAAPPKATRTAAGVQVQFASHATITTPTVYERAVIVSGGFQSQQLYAYEAKTGNSIWALELHDDGPSSPACESGVCVINTESCTIFAIAADTGKLLWSYWLGDPLTSAPTIAGNRVFASYPAAEATGGKPRPENASHALAAFELKTGKILWQLWLDSDVMSAPVAVGEFVYVTTFHGTVIKLEQATGKVRYAMRAKATSAPVVKFENGTEQMFYTRRGAVNFSDDNVEGQTQTEMLIRADHNSPKTKWKAAEKKADHINSNAQSGTDYAKQSESQDANNGFSGGAPASANAKSAYDNVGVGSVSSMQAFQGSRVVHMRERNVNTMGDEVIATDPETGNKLWTYKLPGDVHKQGGFLGTAPLAAGGSIMLGTLKGEVLRLDQKSGKPIKTYAIGAAVRSQPVVEGGWIYVGTEDGKLVAIDTKDPTVTGWTTWGGNAQRTGIAR